MALLAQIKNETARLYPVIVEYRQHLHRHPELSFREYETSAFIKRCLDSVGVTWAPVAGTGIVAIIKGDLAGDEVIALRADIDALPIAEMNQTAYVSTSAGVMHACGHDAHTASLIGVAILLQSLKSNFGGAIKLLFQPGEEVLPGGAQQMIAEGALQHPVPASIIGQHVMPSLPAGKMAIRKGTFMASKDDFYFTVRGRGGHGAQPQENIDPVVIAAHIITSLQQLVSRFSHPATPSVLSIGRVQANGSVNVIPDEVIMEGAFRTTDEKWRYNAHEKIITMAKGMAMSMGGICEVMVNTGYPSLENASVLTDNVTKFAQEYLGEDNVEEAALWMASEDFAYYTQQTDGCFYLLGTGNVSKGITSSLHTPSFDIDESVLSFSSGLMAYIALKQLGN